MKNKLPLIVALIIGVMALFAIRSYVNRMEENTQAQLRGEPVAAASTEIPAGTEITMQMITAKQVPGKFTPPQAIGQAKVTQILGRKAAVRIQPGQLILWSDLATEGRGGLASIIPVGEGAYTVTISKGIKASLIQPSDHVDIIGSFAAPKPTASLPSGGAAWRQASDMVNVVLLQNVTVLAVGDQLSAGGRNSTASTSDLTLSLTLREAQLLMFAAQHGELGAVLRREGDNLTKSPAELPRLTFEAIDKVIGDLDGRRSLRLVEVQQGLKSTTVPVMNPEPVVNAENLQSGGRQ